MIFRVRFEIGGHHVHCRLFIAKAENQTFAKCGEFVVRKGDEFRDLLASFKGAQFIGDDKDGIVEACKP
jgi:hypothetical protein